MIGAAAADAIDCDVHIAVPGFETLSHYLDEYWHSYIDDATVRLVLPAYPPGVPTTGPAPAGSHDELVSAIDSVASRPCDPRLPDAGWRSPEPVLRKRNRHRGEQLGA